MNPISGFKTVDVGYPYRLRGTGNTQGDTGLMFLTPGYKGNPSGTGTTVTTERTQGISIRKYALHNRSATTGVHGFGIRVPNKYWVAGQWVNAAGTPYTNDTADAQSTTTGDFPLETTTTNDGFVVASRVPFNALSIQVATASTGSPVRAMRYSNTAGTAWTAMSNFFIQDYATTNTVITTTHATEFLIVWAPPTDWGKTATGGLSGIPEGMYAVNVRATTAPTVASIADCISVYRLFELYEGLQDNTVLYDDFGPSDFTMAEDWNPPTSGPGEGLYGDALVALFETANIQNRATFQVRSL